MVTTKPTRKMEFTGQDEDFIRQISEDIGCYYHKASERTYSMNKYDSDIHGEMGVFAWVHKESEDYFWVTTRRVWVEEAKASTIGVDRVSGTNCFPRDTQNGDSVILDTRDGYQKTVGALKLISRVR